RKSQDDRSKDFITPSKVSASGEAQEQDISPTLLDAAKTLTHVASGGVSTYKRRRRSVDTDKAPKKGKAKMIKEDVLTIQKTKKQIEQEKAGFAECTRMVDMVNQRKNILQKKELRQREGTWKLSQLKKLTFEEIEKFDKLVKQIDTFVPMGLEATKAIMKRYSEELQTGTSKKQKTVDDSGSAELQEKVAAKDVPVTEEKDGETTVPKEEEEDSETDKEEDMEAIFAIHVAIKSPTMLKDITRDDLTELYRLVIQKYRANRHEDVYDRRYYDSCEVHCLTLEAIVIYMLTERKYPLSSDACQAMLDMKLQEGKQNEECYQLLKLIEKQINLCLHKLAITLNRLERSIHWDQQVVSELVEKL
ncbi:hypothetical protein Tco_0185101, partial [Tanacetum coccineum]